MRIFTALLAACVSLAGDDGKSEISTKAAAAAKEAPATPRPATPVAATGRAQSPEARRNENTFIIALDNNAQKEANVRTGITATIISDFTSASRYFGAEYGVTPSGPIHVPGAKPASGMHGQAYWIHGNSVFSARSFFQAGSVKPARDNAYGLSFTAGLWKNAQFTVDASQTRTRGFVNGNILVPLPDERNCLSPDPRICALVNRFFQAWPKDAPNRPDIDRRALNTNSPQSLDRDNTTLRLDQTISKRHRLTARHSWSDQQVDAFQLVAGQNPDTTTKSHDARFTWNTAWNPRMLLDATAGFSRARALLVPEPNAVGPQVQVGTALEKLGPGAPIPVDRVQNRYRLATRLSRQDGNHNWSAGVEFSRLQFNGREVSSNRGNIYFRNDFGRDAITNFRLGASNRYTIGIGEVGRGFRRWEHHAFAQDIWRAFPRLTFSYGIRYQPYQTIQEVNELTNIPFRCDCNNVAPNFGFAWRGPKSLGVLRGAYALQYGEVFPATLQQLRWNPPLFQKIEVQSPNLLDPLANVNVSPEGRATVFHVPSDLKTPYSHQYNFSWELPMPRAAGNLQLGYVGTRTWKLFYMVYENRARQVPGIAQTTATINDRRPDNRYFDFRPITNGARAYFDAGRVTYTLPSWRGMTVDSAYWFSKAIDTGAAYTSIAAGDEANQGQAQNTNNIASDLRGVSAFDQSHAAITRFSYLTGRPRGSALARIAGEWRISTVFLAKSGTPFSVLSGSDGPGYGNVDGALGDRPHLLDPSVLGRAIDHPDVSRALLPRSAFLFMQPTEARGNLGFNTFRRSGIRNLNAALERRFNIATERTILFRAESINFLNTPQFAEPVFDLSNPAFGMITNTLNDGRTFRFTLRLEF